jgi:RecA/RadA recombinase
MVLQERASMIRKNSALANEMKAAGKCSKTVEAEYDGNNVFVSTGSTLLDLAISGGRVRGGGIPGGILVEIFGPSGAGKTVLLCEIAGSVRRAGGDIMFKDPEARLNKQFAGMFGLDLSECDYDTPNTVTEVFESVRSWKPNAKAPINGVFTDSLAALSTNLEMDNEDGDKMGMRRAKEFSEECRKTCRIIQDRGILMVCSNQLRQNPNAGPYAPKFRTSGGEAIPFYASLRLKVSSAVKIKDKKKIAGKEVTRIIGVDTEIEVYKSTVWKPYHEASICINFDYGIDDIRSNLQFIKTHTKATTYTIGGQGLGTSIHEAIAEVEEDNLEAQLKEETIDLWQEIEDKFKHERKPKVR